MIGQYHEWEVIRIPLALPNDVAGIVTGIIWSIIVNPYFSALAAFAGGWIVRVLYERYMENLRYSQRIAQDTIGKVMGYTEKHYSPLSSRGYQLINALNASINGKESLKEDFHMMALYRFAQYLATENRMTKEIGGMLVMKDPHDEKTLVKINSKISDSLPFKLSEREYLAELGELRFTEFEAKLTDQRFRNVRKCLQNWVKEEERVKSFCKYVKCQNEFMMHALGTVYRPWYGKKIPPISEESTKILQGFQEDR